MDRRKCRWIGGASAAVVAVSMFSATTAWAQVPASLSGQVTPNTIYFYDYANGTDDLIPDISGNGHDLMPGELVGGGLGTFAYGAGSGPVAGEATVDFAATATGGLTTTINALGNQEISDAGGFFFETWINRSADTPGQDQHLFNPEGTHSVEFRGDNQMQLALRGIAATGFPPDPATATTTNLPVGEWHHFAAVFVVTTPLPPAGDPASDPLLGIYRMFVDGIQVGPDVVGDLQGGFPGAGLEDDVVTTPGELVNPRLRHGIGTTNFGTPGFHLRGELALTQLGLLPEPTTLALVGLGGALMAMRRRHA